jgi:hypothetical protein
VEGSRHVGFRGLAVCFAISERSMLELSRVAGYEPTTPYASSSVSVKLHFESLTILFIFPLFLCNLQCCGGKV